MAKGLSVTVGNHHGAFEKAMRKFKKKVENDGILRDYREREHFVSPSEQRKIDKKRAINRRKKKQRDAQKSLDSNRNGRV